MTWAQNQRLAWIKEKIEAGEKFNRKDLAEKFNCTLQTSTATINEFQKQYPGLMKYSGSLRAFVSFSHVPDNDVSWKDRAIRAETILNGIENLVLTANAMNMAIYHNDILNIINRHKKPGA